MNTSDVVTAAVRSWLHDEKLTQDEGARVLSVAPSTMKAKLRGVRPWKLEEINRLIELDVLAPLEEKQK